jgi:energy-coupling factor transporter ATP-binding protein EcfA2
MITRLEIKGFKSLVDVSIELGAVNVFIGANGSGKSNLLEAVGVLGACVFGSVEPESLKYRGVRLGIPESYKSSFKSQPSRRLVLEALSPDAKYYVEFENLLFNSNRLRWRIEREALSNEGRSLLIRDSRECILSSPGHEKQRIILSDDQSAAMLALRIQPNDPTHARSLLEQLEGYAIFTPTTPTLRGVADDVARDPLGLGGSGLPGAVDDLIDRENRAFGPFDLDDVWELIEWANDVSTVSSSKVRVSPSLKTGPEMLTFVDRYMRGDPGVLSGYDASEGALHVLFMLALFGHQDSPRLVGIDNFDQALHPRLAFALTRLISDQILDDGSRQMLATTHNPLVLDGLDLLDDRIRLFTVDRDSDGTTRINRVTVTEELMAQADKGLSLSRLWVMGRLGGVPNNF